MPEHVSTEEIVASYREFGSVWKVGKHLGLAGQTVWERLRSIGHPMRHTKWTNAEHAELEALHANGLSLLQISQQLGRPYGSVATKISQRGLSHGRGRQNVLKLPRGAGWDKETTRRRISELERYDGTITRYARSNGINVDPLVAAIQRYFPEWWDAYAEAHSELEPRECPNCHRLFYAMNAKQRTCSRRCTSQLRSDTQYFGGKRSQTIGLAEGICQLCLEKKPKLSSHHVYGKENDPENEFLVALCSGCHQLVGRLASRRFADKPEGWEILINLVLLRRLGPIPAIRTYVDIEVLTEEQQADEEAHDAAAHDERQLPLMSSSA